MDRAITANRRKTDISAKLSFLIFYMMLPAEEIERKTGLIEDAYNRISKLQEEIPAYLNEESDVIGADPQELNISLPPLAKERGCMYFPFSKKKSRDQRIEDPEEPEVPEEWDTREEAVGRFDEHGNFVLEEATPAEESSTGEDWIVVEQKTKKKKQKEREEPMTYTATQLIEPKKMQVPAKKPVVKTRETEAKGESDTDSDGFKLVLDKRSKKHKKLLK